MARHANPRLYIGPQTHEVIVSLGRSFGVSMNTTKPDVRLEIKRRKCGEQIVSDWLSYAVDTRDQAHFQIPAAFIDGIEVFPRGFYDGKVFVGECHVADIELIKAPGHYAQSARTIEERCHGETDWLEPDCVEEAATECGCNCNGAPDKECDCRYKIKNNCPTCFNEVFVSRINLIEGYTDWVEKEAPPPVEESELDQMESTSQVECKPLIETIQKSDLIEGYADVDKC